MQVKGIGASNGISTAKVFELAETKVEINDHKISNIDQESAKVEAAIKQAIAEIEQIKNQASKNLGAEEAAIFDAHIQVASDPTLISGIKDLIAKNKVNALYATKEVTEQFASMFASMDDAYMKERAADVKDVAKKIINALAGIKSVDLSAINEEVIIVAVDLTPSETALLNKKYVKGFLTDIGGRTSHAAIMARSLEIPAVLGLKDITKKVKTGDQVAMDGESGEVLINPTAKELETFKIKQANFAKEQAENAKFRGKVSQTKDQKHVELAANIGSPKDALSASEHDAEGVGLFRSEFLYMDASNWPTEEEQFLAYKEALEHMPNKRVIVRTLDIGGDKKLNYYKFPEEMNPFLGYRAIRMCLDQPEVFNTQLRALLRASIYGKLGIMFPMIATINEFKKAKELLEKAKANLLKEGHKVSEEIEVGMMVEVPSTAVLAEQFAQYADFFSIGTNDLMQYTMAADRMSEKIAYLYQPLNPAMLKMIDLTIQGAHKHGKWVGMCGEMAGDKNAIPFLVGMGLDEFSMSATSILAARRQIANIDSKKAQKLVQTALTLDTEDEVKKLLEKFNKQN